MGKSAPSAPAAPDPAKTAASQSAANREAVEASARVNAIDIFSPLGSTTYTKTPEYQATDANGNAYTAGGVPTAQTTTLNPAAQAIFDKQQGIAGNLTDVAAIKAGQIPTGQFSLAGLPYDPAGYSQPLLPQWSGVAAPFDPAAPQYAADAAQMRAGGAQFGAAAQTAGQRADSLYGAAGAPGALAGQVAQRSADYQTGAQNLPFDPRSYGANLNTYNADAAGAFYNRQASLMAPQFDQQSRRLEQGLSDRGIPIGSEAYNSASGELQRNQTDAYQRLANDSVIAGGAEAQRQLAMEQGLNSAAFGQGQALQQQYGQDIGLQLGALGQGFSQQSAANQAAFGIAQGTAQQGADNINNQTAFEQGLRGTVRGEALQDHTQTNSDIGNRVQFEQNLRGQAVQEQLLGRTQAFNEASALLQGAPALGIPQAPAVPTYNVGAADVQGLTMANYQAQQNAYAQQMASRNATTAGLFGLGGSLIGAIPFSHSSLKDIGSEVEPTISLDTLERLKIYRWNYTRAAADALELTQQLHIGPMAEDWQRETGLGDGIRIDLTDVCGVLISAVQALSEKIRNLEAATNG